MTAANGKLIIRGIPSEEVAQRVITYICANAKNTTPEAVAAKLKELPLILSSSISAQVANRIVQSLMEIGADAVYIPHQSTTIPPEPGKPPSLQSKQKQPTPIPANNTLVPAANEQTSHVPPRGTARKPVDNLCEVAVAQKILICAVAASLLPIFSPYLFFPAVAIGLYAVYRICRVLQIRMFSRVVYLTCTIIPLFGIFNLLIINSKATAVLRAGGVTVGLFGAHRSDLDRLGVRKNRGVIASVVYLGVLIVVTFGGITTGLLRLELPDYSTETEPAQTAVPDPKDPVPFPQTATPEVRDEIAAIYENFHKAKLSGNVDEIMKYASERTRKEMQSESSMVLKAVTGKVIKATTPSNISITDCTISPDGNMAVLALAGKTRPFGTETENVGLVSLIKEGIEWKVDLDTWKVKGSRKGLK